MGGKLAVERRKWIVERFHEDAPEQVDDEEARPLRVLDDRRAPPRRAGWVIGRADEARLALNEHQNFALIEGVVSERHGVDPGGEELLEDQLRETEAAGGVFPIGDDEIEIPPRPQDGRLLKHRGAARTPDNVPDEQEPHSALAYEDGFLFGHDGVQALIMSLIRHGGDFANPISNADRMDCLHRPQARKAPIVVSSAIADAPAAPIEAGQRRKKKIRLDDGRGVQRFGNAHRANGGRVAGAPQAELKMRSSARDYGQRDVETLVHQPGEQGEHIRFFAYRMEARHHRRLPQTRQSQTLGDKPRRQPGSQLRSHRFAPRQRAPAQLGLQIGVGRGQDSAPIFSKKFAEPRRPLDGDPGRLRK